MSIWDDIKKGLKGSEEYQAAKAKKKASKKTKKASLTSTQKKQLKNLDKSTKSGKIRKGAKSFKVTKGGAYPKYEKKSKPAKSFREAFASARKAKGAGKTFTWDGRSYSTNTADDVKKSKASKKKKSSGVGRLDRDKVGGKVKDKRPIKVTAKTDARPKKKKKPTVYKTHTPSEEKSYVKPKVKEQSPVAGPDYEKNPDLIAGPKEKIDEFKGGGIVDDMKPKYEGGGKVEGGGLFNFPIKNSRNR